MAYIVKCGITLGKTIITIYGETTEVYSVSVWHSTSVLRFREVIALVKCTAKFKQ